MNSEVGEKYTAELIRLFEQQSKFATSIPGGCGAGFVRRNETSDVLRVCGWGSVCVGGACGNTWARETKFDSSYRSIFP